MKIVFNIFLILVTILLGLGIIVGISTCNIQNIKYYKAKNLELNRLESIISIESFNNCKPFFNQGDTVFVDSTNTINNIDSNTMQYLIIKPLN